MGELTYVPSQTKIYGICGSGQIIQIDPYTLAISQVATLGPAYFTPPSITNDGSYLYTVSSNAVVKISLSDFSTVYAGYGSFFAGTYVLGA